MCLVVYFLNTYTNNLLLQELKNFNEANATVVPCTQVQSFAQNQHASLC